MKKAEANDIVQCLLPELNKLKIPTGHCKIDTSTDKSGRSRGDVWISTVAQSSAQFERSILALIEAKHRNSELGDMEWRDAMAQGRTKAASQGLPFYIVTNCRDTHRFYNTATDEEIGVDGTVVTRLQTIDVLAKIRTQVTAGNSHVIHKAVKLAVPVSEAAFRNALQQIAHVYRSCGMKEGDERIDPTVSFVVLKYIGETETVNRTLSDEVKIWPDYGSEKGNYRADVDESRKDIFGGDCGDVYLDFKELVSFPTRMKNDHYRQIYEELTKFSFHGCGFDVFGAIYEEFATQTKKKEFGEFYTRRHITGVVARLLLRSEFQPRPLRICDPACGTGGFLTEAFKALVGNYSSNAKLNPSVRRRLRQDTFWGYDNDDKSVLRAKLNMFLVGDGHNHIYRVTDSLAGWSGGWAEGQFEYILTNPPMGPYKGAANIADFKFTNERRTEMLFLERIIEAAMVGGEMAVIVPDGLLEAVSREQFRIKLLDNCDVLAIVSLTRFAFAPYTKEKTYVVFLRKKQEEHVGVRQVTPIWNFIVDFDGFANSDKRFRTKYHDDLPELEERFPGAVRLGASHDASVAVKRADFERSVNRTEQEQGLSGMKCAFVDIARVNADNFHNLLSEFHLRPVTVNAITETDLRVRHSEIVEKLGMLAQPPESSAPASTVRTTRTIDEMFDYYPGNHGLTEDVIYEQQPTSLDDVVPIFSGSQDNETPIGFIKTHAVNKHGSPITYFTGPCLILTKDGSAGLLTFKDEGSVFTINHHACVLRVKDEWKERVHLRWFAHQYQNRLFEVVTSKSDNKVFSTEWFPRLEFEMPEYPEQKRQWDKIAALVELGERLRGVEALLADALARPLGKSG